MADAKLTLEDPVDATTLNKMRELMMMRQQAADRLLDLEEEKIRTLRVAAGVGQERQKLFESILVARGLPPNFPVEIDATTGKIAPVAEALSAQMQSQKKDGIDQE